MNSWKQLNLDLKQFIQAGLGTEETPELQYRKAVQHQEMTDLADGLTPILNEHSAKTVVLALAYLLSEQLDLVPQNGSKCPT